VAASWATRSVSCSASFRYSSPSRLLGQDLGISLELGLDLGAGVAFVIGAAAVVVLGIGALAPRAENPGAAAASALD